MSETKLRPCDQHDCPIPATHTLVWTLHQYYCSIHVRKALEIAQAMGFPTPEATVRKLEPDEMILDKEST